MRPVFRGNPPVDNNSIPIVYSDYKDARDDLIQRLGDYCSYCEVSLPSQVDVEHVLPKGENPDLELDWSNFLLSCGNCNSVKGSDDIALNNFYWPHLDNTLRAFVYEHDQPPQVVDDPEIDQTKAQRTLELTGLDRVPGHPKLSARDRRWRKRFQAWGIARLARNNLTAAESNEMRATIILVAQGIGFWSVWFAVFWDDEDMRRRLIQAFPGTACDCFDDTTKLVPRPDGAL